MYALNLTRDGDTTLVEVPAFPEIHSFGSTAANVLHWARLAVEEAIAVRVADGDPIPAPLTEPPAGPFVRLSSVSERDQS